MRVEKPNVLNYLSINDFLLSHYQWRKYNNKRFSYQAWAEELPFKSRSLLRMIINGKRSITSSIFPLLLKNLQLSVKEAEQFDLLWRYSQTKAESMRKTYRRKIIANMQYQHRSIEIKQPDVFMKDTFLPILFTYLSYEDAPKNTLAIAEALRLNKQQVEEGILSLEKMNLIRRRDVDQVEVLQPNFSVPDMAQNIFIERFHLEGLQMAEAASKLPSDLRKFRALLFALNEEQFLTAQQMIIEFSATILKQMSEQLAMGKRIYRLNMQIFPVSQKIEKSS